ncbi:hypothetical protein FACS18942_01330 [Planctomycetales bacterium]|nr:hypothetical protein FACS18942_01330 [Planctomycetales bacterium]GHT34930.1 hypothetical protein FACS189427_03190 [Planctomycetales bacterium]
MNNRLRNYSLFIVNCSLFVIFLAGCGSKPSDVPLLYPCRITVVKNAAPLEGVEVLLGLQNESLMCVTTSNTNSSGVAEMRTKRLNWEGAGAPKGEYVITLIKYPKLEGGLSLAEFQKLEPLEQEKYQAEQAKKYDALPREVPEELSSPTKSPFKLTVSEGQENNLEIDISTFKPKKK